MLRGPLVTGSGRGSEGECAVKEGCNGEGARVTLLEVVAPGVVVNGCRKDSASRSLSFSLSLFLALSLARARSLSLSLSLYAHTRWRLTRIRG